MQRTSELAWHHANTAQVRGILTRNKISAKLFTEALKRFADPDFKGSDTVYLIDTLTNKGARVTLEGGDAEYNVKVSSHTAEEFFDNICAALPLMIDYAVIMG